MTGLDRAGAAGIEIERGIGGQPHVMRPLLSVPSALVPETRHVLLNPAHPDATQITVIRISEHVVNARLLA